MLTIKKAQPSDSEFIYDLRFSNEVMATSLTHAKPTLEQHQTWFKSRLDSQDVIFFIGYLGSERVGYVRYDCKESTAEVSIALHKLFRGKGHGKQMLLQGEEWLKSFTTVKSITARVVPGNEQSLRMFASEGYSQIAYLLEKVIK